MLHRITCRIRCATQQTMLCSNEVRLIIKIIFSYNSSFSFDSHFHSSFESSECKFQDQTDYYQDASIINLMVIPDITIPNDLIFNNLFHLQQFLSKTTFPITKAPQKQSLFPVLSLFMICEKRFRTRWHVRL
jgi:hypothetical protein